MVNVKRWLSSGIFWTIVGLTVTLMLGVPALYLMIIGRTPSLKYEITSEANVFDLHKSMDNLDIIFQGRNIRQAKQNLRIITLTLSNDGRADILQNHFDENLNWGFMISDAELVDAPRIVDSNSEYLRESLQPMVINTNTIVLQKSIIESGKYVSLELLLLHNTGTSPTIQPIGKIAGIDALAVTRRTPEHVAVTFWGSVIQGSAWVHLFRVGLYTLILVIILIVVILVLWQLSNLANERQYRRETTQVRDRSRHFLNHFNELFHEMTTADKEFALAILDATGARLKPIEELRTLVCSEAIPRQLEEIHLYLSHLSESSIGKMFPFASLIPDAIFERIDDKRYSVTAQAKRVVPALADFLAAHPVPDGLTTRHAHPWYGPVYGGGYKEEDEGLSWQLVMDSMKKAQEQHPRRSRIDPQVD